MLVRREELSGEYVLEEGVGEEKKASAQAGCTTESGCPYTLSTKLGYALVGDGGRSAEREITGFRHC